jgi:HSP20 family molecular chaperone IbpA
MTDPPHPSGPGADAPPVPRPPHTQGELWADDGTSRAEVQVEGDRLQVTLAVPEVAPEALDHFVGSNILVLWSKDDPETQRTVVRLPEDVRPETAVIRCVNGVFDLTVLLAHPSESTPSMDGSA